MKSAFRYLLLLIAVGFCLPAGATTLIGPGVYNGSFEGPKVTDGWPRPNPVPGWGIQPGAGYVMNLGYGTVPAADANHTDGDQAFQPYNSSGSNLGFWSSWVVTTPISAGTPVSLSVAFGYGNHSDDGPGSGWRGYLGQRVIVYEVDPGNFNNRVTLVTLTSQGGSAPAIGTWNTLADSAAMVNDGWYLQVEGKTGNLDGAIITNANSPGFDMSWSHHIDNVRLETDVVIDPDPVSPIGWYKFDTGSGSTAFDSSGNGGDGTISGASWFLDPEMGWCLEFDGGDWVDIPGAFTSSISHEATIAFWQKGNGIIDGDDIAGGEGFTFFEAADGTDVQMVAAANGMIWWGAGQTTWDDYLSGYVFPYEPLINDQWSHWAFVKHGGASSMQIWHNGVMIHNLLTTSGTVPIGTSADFRIGSGLTTAYTDYKGRMSDFQIYNKALSTSEIGDLATPLHASTPDPANNAEGVPLDVVLGWTGGREATAYDLYLGITFDDVNNATIASHPQVTTSSTSAESFDPGGLNWSTTYYWRVDSVNGPDLWRGPIWSFTTERPISREPVPFDSQREVSRDTILLWTKGPLAVSCDVYFGSDANAVDNAVRLPGNVNGDQIVDADDARVLAEQWLGPPAGGGTVSADLDDSNLVDLVDMAIVAADFQKPADGIYKGHYGLNSTGYDPGTLEPNTTYYWRVDDVTASGDSLKGDIWSFQTPIPYHVYTTLVDDDTIAYATFQSHNQKVISNDRGIFATYVRTANTYYTAQQWRLVQSTDGGESFTTVFEQTDATNPAPIETDTNNNIYLVYPDWGSGNAYFYRFLAGSGFASPPGTTISAGASGKVTMTLDESRQRCYYYSNNGRLATVGFDGTLLSAYRLTRSGAEADIEYPLLTMADNGDLYAAWTTERFDSYIYWNIGAAKSTDGGVSWTTLDGGTALATPILDDDTGPATHITDSDELSIHSWLCSILAKDGKLHFVYWVDKNPHEMRYKRYDQATGALELDSDPFFADNPSVGKNNSGFFCTRRSVPGSTLYYITGDRQSVYCFASDDNGANWYEYAVGEDSYPINNAGWHGVYSFGGARELTADGHIIGSFTEVADYAFSYFEPHSGKMHFLRIQGGLSSVNIASADYAAGSLTINFDQVRGNPIEIRFDLGADNWNAWQPFNTTMVVPLANAPTRYQLKSSLDVESLLQNISY